MKHPVLLALAAVVGAAIALYVVLDTNRAEPSAAPSTHAAQAPFAAYVEGTGITETGRGNVALGTPVSGVVSDLYVHVGDSVAAGAPLFKIDDRDLQARSNVALAKVAEARAALAKPAHRLDFLSRLQHRENSAVSRSAISDVRDDMVAARSALDLAQAEAAQAAVDIDRSLVRAPSPGRILQLNVRPGEYVQGGGQARPLLLLGDDSRVYVRVDIDENDAWRLQPGAAARAYVRGNPQLQAPLRFEYIEPVVLPKTALSGQSTERADVRVLQAVYSFPRTALPVYLGQQMDVFIQAAPAAPNGGAPH